MGGVVSDKKFIKSISPLPEDAFDNDELVESKDKGAESLEDMGITHKDIFPEREIYYELYDDPNCEEFVFLYEPEFFCDYFVCCVKNEAVCKTCGVYWKYFSIMVN